MKHPQSLIGNAFVVRWNSVPDAMDNQALLRQLRELRKTVGAGLLFCGIIPDGVAMPDAREREAMQALTPALLECVTAIQLVIDGTGIARTMMRTMVRGMTLAQRRGDKVLVHASFEDFLRANERTVGIDRQAALQRAQQQGLI